MTSKPKNTIIVTQTEKLPDLTEQTFDPKGIIEAMTGLAPLLLSKEGLVKIAGTTLQGLFRGNYVEQLSYAWSILKEKGRIAADQFTCETITEMADFLDSMKVADEERFKVAQKFFCQCCRIDKDDDERRLARQMLILVRELASEEIRILRACYELATHKTPDISFGDHFTWASSVAKKLGHNLSYLVMRYENHLVALGLFGELTHSDHSGVRHPDKYRLTDLALKFCAILDQEE